MKENNWLTEQQFVDSFAVAMITPGPVIIAIGFISCLIAGFPGVLVGAVIVIASRNILDIPTALIAIVAIFALLYIEKIQEPYQLKI
ncbi:chromate transporter [Flavobacterium humi]|uniref:chromate transporter n=1 Tax=Flavobacterium humi TaxID=2562683 RepID=UPI001FEBA0B6|nr:chromate transporter [Flavobacterium humi]